MAEATESTGAGLAEQQMPSDQSPSAQQAVTPQRSSLRQANRNTFKRMLQQKQQEEQEFALFERTVEARLRRGKRPAPSSPPPPPAAAAAAAGEDGVVVVVKRRRGRPPKPRPPQPPKPLLIGGFKSRSCMYAGSCRVHYWLLDLVKPKTLCQQLGLHPRARPSAEPHTRKAHHPGS